MGMLIGVFQGEPPVIPLSTVWAQLPGCWTCYSELLPVTQPPLIVMPGAVCAGVPVEAPPSTIPLSSTIVVPRFRPEASVLPIHI